MDNPTIEELILHHVIADGPVSFNSIALYVKEQYFEIAQNYQIARALNELIRNHQVALYDDGVSFY